MLDFRDVNSINDELLASSEEGVSSLHAKQEADINARLDKYGELLVRFEYER